MGCASLPIGASPFLITINTADATLGVNVGSPVAGKSYCITDMVVSTDTELWISMTESDNDPVTEKLYFPATAIWSKIWSTPITLHASTNLVITASVAGNITVTISGYLK